MLFLFKLHKEKNNFLQILTYMEKIKTWSNLPKNLVDLDHTVEKNVSLFSEAKNTTPDKITVCILELEESLKHIR